MANCLKMAQIESIRLLAKRGWSRRRIARELGIHRETVARHLDSGRVPGSKPAISTTGSDPKPAISTTGSGEPKPANSTAGSAGRQSIAGEFREQIEEGLLVGLSAIRIHQDLVAEQGYEGSYESVKRFVRKLRGSGQLPFRRMECDPGHEAQIDFGTGAPVLIEDGRRKRPHLFVFVLSHSRKSYAEVVWRQTTDEFIRCLENAFLHFGGAPRTLVIDNLKAAVTKADWYDPEIHPKLAAFAQHYGTSVLPTKPYTPRHKGKVEGNVKYVQSNALKGRSFRSLQQQNDHLRDWLRCVADHRIHGTTRKQVGPWFEEHERDALAPLPADRFPDFREGRRKVHRDGHVELDRAFYSVPPEYLAASVWVRWDSRLVRIFNDRFEQIAVHAKADDGRFSTHQLHLSDKKISAVERGAEYLLTRARLIGSESQRWTQAMIRARGIAGIRVLQGFLRLATEHRADAVERACKVAASHGAYRLRTLRRLIREPLNEEQKEFLETHPLIRDMSEYGRIARWAIQESETTDHSPTKDAS